MIFKTRVVSSESVTIGPFLLTTSFKQKVLYVSTGLSPLRMIAEGGWTWQNLVEEECRETRKSRHVHSTRRTGRLIELFHQLLLRIITEGSLDRLRSLSSTILVTKRSLQHLEMNCHDERTEEGSEKLINEWRLTRVA
jgi:hypothetical protein